MKQENSLIKGSVFKALVTFTVPILFALILQIMYSTVDMLVVSNFGTVADISGVASGSQLMNILVSLCTGLATGTTILIGQFIGKNEKERVSLVIGNSIKLFIIISIVIMAIFILGNSQLVNILNTPQEAIKTTAEYIFYCSLGIPFIFIYNILGSIFRGIGNSKLALVTVGIAAIVNMIIDIILVAGFGMGAKGAAIATAIAQTVSVILSIVIIKKQHIFTIHKEDFKFKKEYITDILKLGIPIALQSVLVSFSFLAITIIVNQFGVVFSASIGVVEKLTGIIMLVPLAYMQSMSVFTAQNFGAKEYARTKKGLVVGIITSMIPSIFMAYLAYFHGEILLSLFTSDTAIIEASIGYLKAYAFDTLQVPILFCITGFFSGYGKSMFVMLQGVFGALFIRITLTYLFSLVVPTSLFLIGLSTPIATSIQLILCFIYFVYLKKRVYLKR